MKKITILLGCACLMSLTACLKKDRTCTCTYENGNETVVKYYSATKQDVSQHCLSTQYSSFDASSGTTTTGEKITCKLE